MHPPCTSGAFWSTTSLLNDSFTSSFLSTFFISSICAVGFTPSTFTLAKAFAKSTISWPSGVKSNHKYGTVEFATSHPTTYIDGNDYIDVETVDDKFIVTTRELPSEMKTYKLEASIEIGG